jgi:hypothetical protein
VRELERIERWYRELRGSNKWLRERLRSVTTREFWAALYELMTSRIFAERGWYSRYEPTVASRTPDFSVRCPDGFTFIAEVLTAFQDPTQDKQEAAIHELASRLDRISHRVMVLVEDVCLPSHTVSLDPLVPRVRAWLDRCTPGRSHRITIRHPDAPMTLTLSTFRRVRSSPGPIVQGVMGLGGNITSTDRIRKSIRRKVVKYGNLEGLDAPLVLFLWQGDWLKVTDTSLEWALFGRLRAHISRVAVPSSTKWSHAPGGLFALRPDGTPRGTALSAVVYCSRLWHRGRVYARTQVYHHPYAERPLPTTLFRDVPQFVPFNVTPEQFSCRWDRPHRRRGILLH